MYSSKLVLRTYQQQLINNTRLKLKEGFKKILVNLPCGGGKTVCFAYMAQNHILKSKDNYVWFLVHRQELIDQTIQTFNNFNISLDNILIGMVQTVSRNLDKYKKPTLIIFDEAHHCTAKTWLNIINNFNDVPIIGLTATPCRMDGSSLSTIYETLVLGCTSEYLINNNYLSKYSYYAPNLNLLLPKTKGNDYDVSEINYERKVYGDVLKYIDLNRKTIIYCPNIKFSMSLQNEIPQSAHFDGNTDKELRKEIIRKFRNGEIKVLLNVDLIGEGFDVPDCDCVMLLRPTLSTSLYIQQSMRCLRYKENKNAVIYDFVGNVYRHGLPTDDRDWSLTKKIKVKNPSSQPDIITRMCNKCFRVYSGNNPICPYCNNNNGKTLRQMEIEKQVELEKIEKLEKLNRRREIGMARSREALIDLARKRGYKNPVWWADMILKGRSKK